MLKNIYYCFLIIILTGCQKLPLNFSNQTHQQISANQQPADPNCPTSPNNLSAHNVNVIQLSNIPQKIEIKNQAIGYTFEATRGKILNYQLDSIDGICVWIQTPNNQVLISSNLPIKQDGKYLIQISSFKNKSFTMELKLSFPSPEKFIQEHYEALNKRQYQKTWQFLSPRFQKITPNYQKYTQWWNSVQEIRIGNIQLIQEKENKAIVYADLAYIKKNGKLFKDSKPHIYLVWNRTLESWQIDEKNSPSNAKSK